MKASITSNYTNIIMGVYQVASIIELYFVLGSVKDATQEGVTDFKQPSVVGIAVTYLTSTITALVALSTLIYFMITFDSVSPEYALLEHKVSAAWFIGLFAMLTIGVILLARRIWKLHKLEAPI